MFGGLGGTAVLQPDGNGVKRCLLPTNQILLVVGNVL